MLSFLFSPHGRLSRKQIWQLYAVFAVIAVAVNGWVSLSTSRENVVALLNQDPDNPLALALTVQSLILYPMIAVAIVPIIKRYHDRGMSGWWVLWAPLIAFAPFIVTALLGIDLGALGSVPNGIAAAWYFATLIAFFVILSVLRGQRGENRFGPDPLGD